MKIAIYIPNLKKVLATTKVALSLEKGFRQIGYSVDFIVQNNVIEEKPKGQLFILKSKNDIGRAKEIKSISKNYDLIFGFMKPMNNVLALSRILGNKKVLIGSAHNNDNFIRYGKGRYFFPRLVQKSLFERLDKIVAVSRTVKEDIRKAFWVSDNKIKVIYNPIDIETIEELSSEELGEDFRQIFERPVLINVGRLEEEKGQSHLLRIFKFLIEKGEDLNLLILGDGKLKYTLKKLTKKLGIEKRVFLVGFQENPYKFIKRSKIFLFTSLREGFGNALIEAMSLGIPFVASNAVSGYREVVNDGGFYADLNNYEDFVIKIKKLLHDKALYEEKSKKAIKISKNFRPEKIVSEYASLFEETINLRGLKLYP